MMGKGNITIYQKLLKSRVFFIFLTPILLALVVGIFQKLYYRYEVKVELDKLNAEIVGLNKQKEDLNQLVDYYKDESNLEKEARVRLNLKKEGEKVVIILPQATSTNEAGEFISGSGGSDIQNLPNYLQWWHYFFDR